jgi:hypothetical protein
VYGLLGRFTAGEIAVTEILSILDCAVFYLKGGYEAQRGQAAANLRPPAGRSGRRPVWTISPPSLV